MAGGYIARHHLPWKMKEEKMKQEEEEEEEPEVLGASGKRGRRICLFE